MDRIGLITFNNLTGFILRNQPRFIGCHYGSQPFRIKMANESGNDFSLGKVLLTQLGKELVAISGAETDQTFLPYLKKEYAKSGVEIIF
jgi:hypothetical protein